jgi:hypothetical protein
MDSVRWPTITIASVRGRKRKPVSGCSPFESIRQGSGREYEEGPQLLSILVICYHVRVGWE